MWDFDGSNDSIRYQTFTTTPGAGDIVLDCGGAFTVSAFVTVDAYVQYRRIMSLNQGGRGFQFVFPTASNNIGALTGSSSSGWGEPAGSPTKYIACSNGTRYHLWLTTEADDATRAFRFWANGTEASSTDGATGYNAGTTNSTLWLGARSDGAQYANVKIGEVAMWQAEMNDTGLIDFIRRGGNPLKVRPDVLKFYAPLRTDKNNIALPAGVGTITTGDAPVRTTEHPNVIYPAAFLRRRVPAGGAVSTTVTPNGPAAIALTGYAPTPTVAASVAPGVGAISLTGYAPGLMISPQPGTAQIALTGLPPVPTVDASVAPGVGALSLTGYAPGLKLGAEPGTGAIIVTGYAPTVEDYGAPVDDGTPSRNPMLASVGRLMNR